MKRRFPVAALLDLLMREVLRAEWNGPNVGDERHEDAFASDDQSVEPDYRVRRKLGGVK